ncbi:hypothetical protein, partial [Flagellimonas beolgyonensis]|uniref:hypothetical protein n=1 Tax=Flagellimonas beolgyonensis TaxID=864064 RepID=UPI003D649544
HGFLQVCAPATHLASTEESPYSIKVQATFCSHGKKHLLINRQVPFLITTVQSKPFNDSE